jgi:putative tryptophan/tyrosine transport system substrate-binding protein
MRRIGLAVAILLVGSLTPCPLSGQTQPDRARTVPRIGYLFLQPWSASAHLREAFRQGLRELGYVEGQNIAIDFRNAEGQPDRLFDLAAELLRLKVDVIVAAPEASIQAVQRVTKTVPIVMAVSFDPVGRGFVASLARPEGNITGLSNIAPELAGKRLELLKEMVPKLSKVAVLWDPESLSEADQLKEMEVAARTLRVRLQSLALSGPSPDFANAFQSARTTGSDALIAVDSSRAFGQRGRIADVAAKNRLPTLGGFREFAQAGGLITYGVSLPDLHRRAATYVDKILKGAKPGDLPVEQPTKFELVINLKTAKALGLTIPQTLLQRADQVIE